jgi:hypothetical protein
MEGFLGGLALALITGLTWLAYKHPTGYRKIATALTAVACATLFAILIHDNAVRQVEQAIKPFIKPEEMSDGLKALRELQPDIPWVFLGFFMFSAFIIGLAALPLILGTPEQNKPDDKRPQGD